MRTETNQVKLTVMQTPLSGKGFKVLVQQPGLGTGFLQIGRIWKTRSGAVKAAKQAFPSSSVE